MPVILLDHRRWCLSALELATQDAYDLLQRNKSAAKHHENSDTRGD